MQLSDNQSGQLTAGVHSLTRVTKWEFTVYVWAE